MARHRPVPSEEVAAVVPGGVPPEIACGAIVGVHGDDLLTAATAYALARRRWEEKEGLDRATSLRLVRARRPVDGADAVARLARLGIDADLEALRRRALRW